MAQSTSTTEKPKRLTLVAAKQAVGLLGFSLKKTPADDYKLLTKGDTDPDHGYFTNDLQDAIDTAKDIAMRRVVS